MDKTILFVTYGGGHARMVVPVIRALQGVSGIHVESLALTLGGPIFKSENLPYKGYKDFITAGDVDALAWGKKLAVTQHSPESGVEEAESIAYLGLSYMDLVCRYGDDEAARLWQEKGRHAFMQLTVMERVLKQIQPDIVVTTNSPKSEQAAVEAANNIGIPTLSMVDLFGIHHFHPLESKYIAVLCEHTIKNMQSEGVEKPSSAFHVTGNPAFDRAFDFRGAVDKTFRAQHFPSMSSDAKVLLWIDMPAYWNLRERCLHIRSDEEIIRDLDTISAAVAANNGVMLIRPHPSQPRAIYDCWMEKHNHPHVLFAGDVPLYPLLKAVDVVMTYTSTVSVEALLMQRRVIQLKYQPGNSDMPLGEWQVAWQAGNPSELGDVVRSAFYNEAEWEAMQLRINSLLPQEKAGPKVAKLIMDILNGAH